MKKASNFFKAIIIVVTLIFILIFSFQNMERVDIDFLNQHSIEIPLFIVLFGILGLGILIGYLLGLISGSKISNKKIQEINIKANEQIAEETFKIKKEIESKKEETLNP